MGKSKEIVGRGGRTDAPAVPERSSRTEIDAFLKSAKSLAPVDPAARGRLVFALDATMSRQPSWDLACSLQAEMFKAAGDVGGLAVQLVYFRGFGECRASRWVGDTAALRDLMVKIGCRGGQTQIRKVLAHTRKEAEKRPVAALVYVGDAVEEDIDALCAIAGEIGMRGVRAFMFHEGSDRNAERAFREIARLTRGAYLPFNAASADELRELLAAVATYAAGGTAALEKLASPAARKLLPSLR
ncbi:VWA domain-containing protein [Afifella sp. IM 167]|uniref:VWA domain-containing protein n=1 Tax=Afifella sp. IM 167 TaxID=2033586 RepID=UPI001CC9641C|nr:VWA domain-containing protein [Afifella sp. IM 167]MBZ8132356.1 hypothetical protein [Afifella sp. IM 167]